MAKRPLNTRRILVATMIGVIVATITAVATASAQNPGVSCTGPAPDTDGRVTLECVVPVPSAITVTTPVPTTVTVTQTVTHTSTIAPSPTSTPTPTSTQTGSPATWPSPSNTGVPAGVTLSTYTGPCTITTPNTVIDAKTIHCTPLRIQTTGVTITRSVIDGGIVTSRNDADNQPTRVTVEDSRLIGHSGYRGIDGSAYIVRRSHITGEISGGWCWRSCLVTDSYIEASGSHTSAFRLQRDGVLDGNTLWCKRFDSSTDGGCSGDLVSYADVIDGVKTVISGNTVTRNLFMATPGWFCFRAGDGSNWTVTNNTFQQGSSGVCSEPGGAPVSNWRSGSGNIWSGNVYDDGTPVNP